MELNNITNTGTWGQQVTKLNDNFNKVALGIDTLQSAYQSLSKSAIEAVDTLPQTGEANKIYRLVGTTSYSDYMYNTDDLTTPILMATYNNAIESRPKKASQNLVTSGGVFDNMGALDVSELNATENPHTLAQYVDLSAALAAVPTDYQKGGMSVKFVQSSDNKYVQYRLTKNTWSDNTKDWVISDEGTYIDNSEYLVVGLLNDKSILWAFRKDGNVFFGAGCPPQVIEYVTEQVNAIMAGSDTTDIDGINKVAAFLSDFSTSDTLASLLDEKVDKVTGKSLIDTDYADGVSYIENPEYMNVEMDAAGRMLEANKKNSAEKIFFTDVNFKGNVSFDNIPKDITDYVDEKSSMELGVFYKEKISDGTIHYFDMTSIGKVFCLHLINQSEKATCLHINYYDSSKEFMAYATEQYRRTSWALDQNTKYGSVYLKSGEDSTIILRNNSLYPFLGISLVDDTNITVEICTEQYGLSLDANNYTIPFLGNGKMYIQPNNYRYCHCSRIFNVGKYLIVYFCGGQYSSNMDSGYPTHPHYHTLAIMEKGNYNKPIYKIFDGNPSKSNLHSLSDANIHACVKDNDIYIIQFVSDGQETPVLYYLRKFDTLKFETSDQIEVFLHYNDTTVRWTKENELEMMRTLYGCTFAADVDARTETGDMRYYNGYFYLILAGQSKNYTTDVFPWVLMKSADCITWEPVTNITTDTHTAEISFDICNDIILIHARSLNSYSGYMVCTVDGTVLKQLTQLNTVASKGAVFVKNEKLYAVYNIESNNTHYYKRNKIAIAELNMQDYSLTVIKEYTDMNGFQYFDFDCKDDVVYMSNTEDPRGFNYESGGPYTSCSVAIVSEDIFSNK